ncbi:Predicted aminopeptidase [Collimonas sp. OK242]|jgi:predicted aminopeptidase|uniref:aminopeptidase n=1 Tax=Collimonas sp. OK242 TaxID=1798195 RepID=UPI00089D6CA9|nr:aminopeptidase [Collimonas sp. OK242]SDX96475.1 Predicted aminopeptidase [Collimonas sp. OK242]
MNTRLPTVVLLAVLVAGCAQLAYYGQAANGEFTLLDRARPIDDWLTDPGIDPGLKEKLRRTRQMRSFAVSELGLPDNRSYTEYADLKRPFALWNVVAAPALSLEPKQWCFPIAGCVSYRGYFNQDAARKFAASLRQQGYDVQVSGVPAYSTLGWFSDPLLSTFIRYPDGELARLMFHELAHQTVYAKDDTQFNESFATAVEQAGVERWLQAVGNQKTRDAYVQFEGRKEEFVALLLQYRQRLASNYASDLSDTQKLQRKAAIFLALQADYQVLKTKWGGYTGYDRWFAEPLSNAHLALVATYYELVPSFKALLAQQQTFQKFYAAVARLAALSKDERHRQLEELAKTRTM